MTFWWRPMSFLWFAASCSVIVWFLAKLWLSQIFGLMFRKSFSAIFDLSDSPKTIIDNPFFFCNILISWRIPDFLFHSGWKFFMHEHIIEWFCDHFSDHKRIRANLRAESCMLDVNWFVPICSGQKNKRAQSIKWPWRECTCKWVRFRRNSQGKLQISFWMLTRINKVCD
jgi:hypothetical protein